MKYFLLLFLPILFFTQCDLKSKLSGTWEASELISYHNDAFTDVNLKQRLHFDENGILNTNAIPIKRLYSYQNLQKENYPKYDFLWQIDESERVLTIKSSVEKPLLVIEVVLKHFSEKKMIWEFKDGKQLILRKLDS